ncbi:hypothetical protein L596_027877 [Steinernema carpocapsae]|uniref:Globin domain-containing protein n=2 Tax=Steinernema carpocapsae TaxID=34508 RepID=A0A4U5LWU6_STECR|nr:hypothetical protein L596_027877 [Steinernema carpocapsae]
MGQAESSGYASSESTPQKERRKKSSASTTSSRTVRPRKELLTARQRKILQRSWNKSQRTGLDNIGAHIFLKIYAKDPTVGIMFNLGSCPHTELKYRKFFQDHAMTFTRSLDFVMNHLEDYDRVSKFCIELGKTHVKFMRRGFKTSFWDIFAEALTECAIDWEGGLRCRDVLNGWRTLVSFIIEEMRKGFEKERKRQAAEETVQVARERTAQYFQEQDALQMPSPPRQSLHQSHHSRHGHHQRRFSPVSERTNSDFQRFAATAKCPYAYRASHEQLYFDQQPYSNY